MIEKNPNILTLWGDDIGHWNVGVHNPGLSGYKSPNIISSESEGAPFSDWYGLQGCIAGRPCFMAGPSGFCAGQLKVGLPGREEAHMAGGQSDANDIPISSMLQMDRADISGEHVSQGLSLVGSLLNLEYEEASATVLELLALEFGLDAVIWLTRDGSRLENSAVFGNVKDPNIRVGTGAGDVRLLRALKDGEPLEIEQRPKGTDAVTPQRMTIFPIGIGGEISAGVAILDPIDDESTRDRIVRLCRSIAQPFEILRLRREVERSEQFSSAVRHFSEDLKTSADEDPWMSITKTAAEMVKAESSSLLLFDEKSQNFKVKALLGASDTLLHEPAIGERIAKHVFNSKKAIVVEDSSKSDFLPDAGGYAYKASTFLSSPISIGGRVVGVMSFADRTNGEAFDKDSLELFDAIAPQLSMAMERAELKERAGQFEQLSVTDALTGLLNRRYMEERLAEEVKRSNRHGYPMSFMMLDVDEFKSYNDDFGHPEGDKALRLVGSVIRVSLRAADVAARIGGEEFAVLLPQTTSSEAMTVADRIRTNVEKLGFPHRQITISIGVANCSANLCKAADLVSAADKALYNAKRSGRNRVHVFEDEFDLVPG